MIRTLHLFAGAGGGLLADLILGHEPVCAVEWDAYCCTVLRERAADGWFPGLHVHEGDVRLFDPSPWTGRVDCIHAGFPCQDVSIAGGGRGVGGARSGLYREVIRIAKFIRPQFVFLENSPAIVRRGLGVVLMDLDEIGYDAMWTVLGADDVGADHARKRWWCLARRNQDFRDQGGEAANSYKERVSGEREQRLGPVGETRTSEHNARHMAWWSLEPAVGRVVHGLANRMDRTAAIGNGQVPLCAAAAWKILGGE